MLTRESLHQYLTAKAGTTAEHPFGPDVTVYKVLGKMFALMPDEGEVSISLKCDPTMAEILRQAYPAVTPGYHLNKRHWNTVKIDDTIPDDEILHMIDESYRLVVKSLSKADRERLSSL